MLPWTQSRQLFKIFQRALLKHHSVQLLRMHSGASSSAIIPASFPLVITEAQDSASPQSSWKLGLPNPQPQTEEFNFMCHFHPHWLCVIDLCKPKSDSEECVRTIIPIFTFFSISSVRNIEGTFGYHHSCPVRSARLTAQRKGITAPRICHTS